MNQRESDREIVATLVGVFNLHAPVVGYGRSSKASLPVKLGDVLEPPVVGGVSPDPVDDCRALAMYIIAQHVLVFDHFSDRHRQRSYASVGGIFRRKRGQVIQATVAAFNLRRDALASAFVKDRPAVCDETKGWGPDHCGRWN